MIDISGTHRGGPESEKRDIEGEGEQMRSLQHASRSTRRGCGNK